MVSRRRAPIASIAATVLAFVVLACGGGGSPAAWTAPSGSPATSVPSPAASATPALFTAGPSVSPAPPSTPAPGASQTPAPSASPVPAPAATPAATPTVVSTKPCPESRFECITLAVPRDHFATGGPTWNVTFAIQRAAKQRKGVFVTITGGPGTSGIAAADSYADAFDAAITDHFDIVFLDQRGIGESHPIQCPVATATYYTSTARPQDRAQREAVGRAAQTYVTDCLAEAKADRADLPFYATSQAVEDLDAFRQYLGVERIYLYGESYGTQYVQTYAAAHPDRVAALFVDGPVDLTLDALPWYAEAARAYNDALVATLADCAGERACAADTAGARGIAAYDRLASRLLAGPISFQFPTAKGTFETRQLTIADLENAAVEYMYSQFSRMILQRAITAASAGDYVPLARLAYDGVAVDPETLVAVPDPTYSDAMYYAVECMDYAYFIDRGDPAARLAAWLDGGEAAGINELRLGTTYYGDLPCAYWPARPASAARPAPLTDTPFPIFVLTATLDPATPVANAMRIYTRANDAYFLVTTGGPHIIFGRGEACPDQIITRFLAQGAPPATRVTVCDGLVADPYVRNALPAAADYRTALDFMRSMDDQILSTDDYNYRLDADPITMGCDRGGTLTYRPTDAGTALRLASCAFTTGLPMTGSGLIDDDGALRLDIRLPVGVLHYVRDADGHRSVKGTFRGRSVSARG